MNTTEHRPLEDKLVVASHNAGKVAEIAELIAPFDLAALSAAELSLEEPEETGVTFEENAALKALAAARTTGLPSLADDSGLAVEALDGAPGIHSARWAGPERDFVLAMRNLEEALQQKKALEDSSRRARFISVLCLAFPDGATEFFRGEIGGHLVWPPRGTNGFGYDPMFRPDGETLTFGEMTPEQKHGPREGGPGLSHRARAFADFAERRLGARA